MDLDKAIKKRKSVRSFKNKQVSWKEAMKLVDAGSQIPVAGGRHPIRYIIVEDPKKIDKIAEAAEQTWINKATLVIVVVSKDNNLEALYGDRGRIYSRQQSGASIQNILLKAVDLGLSACWVGSYEDDKIRSILKIEADKQVEAVIPIGYEKPTPAGRKPKKRDLDTFTRWDDLQTKRRPTIFKEPSKFKNY